MGRIAQIGDAAHTLLPTSASGATMAMEDGITLAACLQVSGKDDVPLAARVYNKLRSVSVFFFLNDHSSELIGLALNASRAPKERDSRRVSSGTTPTGKSC